MPAVVKKILQLIPASDWQIASVRHYVIDNGTPEKKHFPDVVYTDVACFALCECQWVEDGGPVDMETWTQVLPIAGTEDVLGPWEDANFDHACTLVGPNEKARIRNDSVYVDEKQTVRPKTIRGRE